MDKYNWDRSCPKCGYNCSSVKYEADLMLRTCKHCDYEWYEEPLTKNKKESKRKQTTKWVNQSKIDLLESINEGLQNQIDELKREIAALQLTNKVVQLALHKAMEFVKWDEVSDG